jgi:gamma-glutamyltranspeptidase/glutathione hydrolase
MLRPLSAHSRIPIKAVARFAGRLILTLAATAASQATAGLFAADGINFRQAVVAADHPAASEAGAKILRKGGNVVDAAVATSFALSVVRPASCGIGGGGFLILHQTESASGVAGGRTIAIDYRERAPAGATAELFRTTDSAEPLSVRGGLASGVPGTVAGLCYAAENYGTLPLAELLEPALQLCREGVPIDAHDKEVQADTLRKLERFPDYKTRFALLLQQYLNDGKPWQDGDRFYSPQRSALERIAAEGRAGFYSGPVAASIVEAATSGPHPGVLTMADLTSYQPTERPVLTGGFHGLHLVTMPPPSSGGLAFLQSLQTLSAWEELNHSPMKQLGHNQPQYVHVIAEALKHAFADRAEFLGDADFVSVPAEKLLSREYATQTAARIQADRTRMPEEYGRFFLNDDGGTSHFSVMDAVGNAVACTETINLTFGSFIVVPEYGILLNNQMDDFTANPGKANAFGLIQSAANRIEPGKKPLSSMTPIIALRDGRAVYAGGASGGPRIITSTLQSFLNHVVFDMPPAEAVAAPRFHHQWSPDELLLEPALFGAAGQTLSGFGHAVQRHGSLAASQAAARTADGLAGGSDPRKHGQPAGH